MGNEVLFPKEINGFMLSATYLISNFPRCSWGTPAIRKLISYIFYHAQKLNMRPLALADLRMSRLFFPLSLPPSLSLHSEFLVDGPSGLGQNVPNGETIICDPANGARPKRRLANNNSLRIWSMTLTAMPVMPHVDYIHDFHQH